MPTSRRASLPFFIAVGSAWCLLTLPLGCGTAETPPDRIFDPCERIVVLVEKDGDDAGREQVRRAIGLWNDLVGSGLTLEEVQDAPLLPVRFQKSGRLFFGQFDPVEGVIYVNDALPDEERVLVIAHELGHAFGLKHVDKNQRISVMNDGNRTTPPNDGDALALARIWGSCRDPAANVQPPSSDDSAFVAPPADIVPEPERQLVATGNDLPPRQR